MTAAYEQRNRARKQIGENAFEGLSAILYNTDQYYTRHERISLGDHLAAVAVEEMMTIVITKIRAKETELRELSVKIYNDETREVNTRYESSARISERAMALEQLADELEL